MTTPSKSEVIKDDHIKWRQQDKEFNEAYKKWRKQNKETAGFYFVENPNELTYQDGVGFIKDYPQAVEARALKGIGHYLGTSVIIIIFCHILCRYILPFALGKLGFDISIDFYANNIYGNPIIIMLLLVLDIVLKMVYPLYIASKKLKLPRHIICPLKICNKQLFNLSIPVVLMFVGLGMFFSNFVTYFLDCFNIYSSKIVFISTEPGLSVFYFVIVVILTPVISEIGIRCSATQLLRQFGDAFAILIISLLTALLSFDITSFCYLFFTSIVASYFLLRTGSVLTSILMRVAINFAGYMNVVLFINLDNRIYRIIVISVSILFIIVGLLCIKGYVKKHTDKIDMRIESQYLSFSEKLTIILTSKSILLSLSIIFIFTVLNLNINL